MSQDYEKCLVTTKSRLSLFQDIESQTLENPRIKLAELTHNLGLDRHTIEGIVRKSAHKSFREFKREKILDKANWLLAAASEGVTIKEIAALLDYSSAAFSRFIKAATGQTPTQIRCIVRSLAGPLAFEDATNAKQFATIVKPTKLTLTDPNLK
jgi:AraC-like DNA-binding protein